MEGSTNIQSWIYRDFEWREAQMYKVGFIGTLNGGKHKYTKLDLSDL